MRTAAGWVLVGGQSKRMGRDKALLPLGSQTLAEYVGSIVAEVASPVHLLGSSAIYGQLCYPAISDLNPGHGPLSGIQTALTSTNSDWNLIVACDLPNLDAGLLGSLLAAHPNAQCVIVDGQPLCGVYHRDCLPEVELAIREKRLRVRELAERLSAARITLDSVAKMMNLNTLSAWEQFTAGHGIQT